MSGDERQTSFAVTHRVSVMPSKTKKSIHTKENDTLINKEICKLREDMEIKLALKYASQLSMGIKMTMGVRNEQELHSHIERLIEMGLHPNLRRIWRIQRNNCLGEEYNA